MSLIDNTKRIVREDYNQKDRNLVGKLGFILNSFMEQTVAQVNGNLGTENFRSDMITIRMTVNASGTPIGNNLIKSEVKRPIGTDVINAVNKSDSSLFPTSHPFISFTTTSADSRVMKILNISGLQDGDEYEITLKVESN